MGKSTPEKTERNRQLVERYQELTSKGGRGGWVKVLMTEFDLSSPTIYGILRRYIVAVRTQKRKKNAGL